MKHSVREKVISQLELDVVSNSSKCKEKFDESDKYWVRMIYYIFVNIELAVLKNLVA